MLGCACVARIGVSLPPRVLAHTAVTRLGPAVFAPFAVKNRYNLYILRLEPMKPLSSETKARHHMSSNNAHASDISAFTTTPAELALQARTSTIFYFRLIYASQFRGSIPSDYPVSETKFERELGRLFTDIDLISLLLTFYKSSQHADLVLAIYGIDQPPVSVVQRLKSSFDSAVYSYHCSLMSRLLQSSSAPLRATDYAFLRPVKTPPSLALFCDLTLPSTFLCSDSTALPASNAGVTSSSVPSLTIHEIQNFAEKLFARLQERGFIMFNANSDFIDPFQVENWLSYPQSYPAQFCKPSPATASPTKFPLMCIVYNALAARNDSSIRGSHGLAFIGFTLVSPQGQVFRRLSQVIFASHFL